MTHSSGAADRPKILRIIARLNIGGPARQAIVLTDRLRGRGFETLLVFGTVDSSEATLEDELAVRNLRVVKLPALNRSIRPWNDIVVAWRMWRVLRCERPDVVHTHTSKAGLLGRVAASVYNATRHRSSRALVVHTFHGHVFAGYFGPVGSRLVRWTERALARVTDIVIAISDRQHDDLVSTYRIASLSVVRVVPLGLELDELLRLERPALRDGAVVTFGFLGRFVPIKNLSLLIEAFAMAHRQVPGIRLRFFGSGPLRSALEAQIEKLGLTAQVEFEGWCRSLTSLYTNLDAVVMTSANEGTPVALIEAQAAGLPVVATEVGGVPDVVRANETGLLVPSGDAGAVAEALVRLATSPGLRSRLGTAGREWVRQHHRADHLVQNLERLYLNELARKRGPVRILAGGR